MEIKNKAIGLIAGIFLLVSLLSLASADVPFPDDPVVTEEPSAPVIPVLGTITGKKNITVGNEVQHQWSLQATDSQGNKISPDKDISDLNYSWYFGVFAIMDNSGNIVYKKDPVNLDSSSTYEGSVSYTFKESGTHYYVPAIVKVKKEYNNGQWEKVSEKVIEKEVKKVDVTGKIGFFEKVGNFFSRLFNWVSNLFS